GRSEILRAGFMGGNVLGVRSDAVWTTTAASWRSGYEAVGTRPSAQGMAMDCTVMGIIRNKLIQIM
ncbi:MAG: hypothetical protein C0443_11605, partial [Comamonadaceae bacterium]|nr:hypothetical protein [Comamonadaceae bacterium]